jgi:hypothetical protein
VIAVQSGRCRVEVGEHESSMTSHDLEAGDSEHSPQACAIGSRPYRRRPARGLHTELDDVVRLEDRYGREGDLRALNTGLPGSPPRMLQNRSGKG